MDPFSSRRRTVADQDRTILGPRGRHAVTAPSPARGRAGSRRTRCETPASSGRAAELRGPWATTSPGRRIARTGRSLACGECRPSARNPGPGDRRASKDTQTTSRLWTTPQAPRPEGGPARSRAGLLPTDTRLTPGRPLMPSLTRSTSSASGDVDMCDLMIADRERTAAERVERFTERTGTHTQKTLLSRARD